MMKINLKILLSSIAFMVLVVGCSKIYDDYEPCSHEQPVSIIATIDNGNLRAIAPTRALDSEPWIPEYVDAEIYERDVDHVFLFIYKKGEMVPHKVIFYYNGNGVGPLSEAAMTKTQVETKTMTMNNASGTLEMNLELYPGTYNFVLLVNSKAALDKVKNGDKIEHPEMLVEENTILTSDDLQGEDRQYLPMVGQSELVVPAGRVGTDADRVPLVPDIKLERVHARVEFILTTVDASNAYLSPVLPLSEVTGLAVVNEEKKYTVMPSDKDYTVTGGGQPNPIRATALSESTPMDQRTHNSYYEGANDATTGKISKLKEQLLPYDPEHPTVKKYIYVASSTLANDIEHCLRFDLKVKFVDDGFEKTYWIPLRNFEKDLPESRRFITRRNTIYRIKATLDGRKLTTDLEYDVIGWTNQDVDIPW